MGDVGDVGDVDLATLRAARIKHQENREIISFSTKNLYHGASICK